MSAYPRPINDPRPILVYGGLAWAVIVAAGVVLGATGASFLLKRWWP